MSSPFDAVVQALTRLPGFGRRSGERAALALAQDPERLAVPLIAALEQLRTEICLCTTCGAFTTKTRNPCPLCSAPDRDRSVICVVEEPADVLCIEKSGGFRGLYHVLMGKLSPAKKTGASDLRINSLIERIEKGQATEVLLALSTDMEGDATVHYLAERLQNRHSIRITRLAFGLPADSGVSYSDPLTLRRAVTGRMPV